MAFMAWSEHFITGIELVDDQHRRLVELIDAVAPMLSGGSSTLAEATPLLDQLFGYASIHFSDEEELMAAGGVAATYLEEHHQLHASFVDELTRMREQAEHGEGLDGSQLLRFLSGWLTFHILGEDHQMARQLKLIARGVPAEAAQLQAGAGASDTSAQAVLNSALLSLFAVNAERNRALSAANTELKSTQAALKALNAGLEGQVRLRTASLEQANLELRQAQAALIQAEKLRAVGQLAAGLAHEINTPVQFVGDSVEFLKGAFAALCEALGAYQQWVDPSVANTAAVAELAQRLDLGFLVDQVPAAIARSETGIRRVAALVAAIQEFAHPDDSAKAPADLNRALTNCLMVVEGQLKGIATVETRLGELPPIPCRIGELNQVFLNLLVNAAESMRKGADANRKLEVGTRLEADRAVVWIADSGTGIPQDVAGRIYEPFFTTKPVGSGTGQGLSAAWSIVVDQHGGQLDFTTAVGKGTTFFVRLPLGKCDGQVHEVTRLAPLSHLG